jgi:putative nucleotidyltransferase with HDIG domain
MSRVTRDDAWTLLNEFTKNPSLIKHALGVETAMRAYAPVYQGDPELWGIVGMLHDFDYEAFPEVGRHAVEGPRIMRERGWPAEIVEAVASHADYTGVPRDRDMRKVLYAVDELVGFVAAVALVRPTKSVAEVDVAAVKKKFKDKAFARGVNRDQIFKGVDELGIDLDGHIARVIQAMQGNAEPLGLQGTAQGAGAAG